MTVWRIGIANVRSMVEQEGKRVIVGQGKMDYTNGGIMMGTYVCVDCRRGQQ